MIVNRKISLLRFEGKGPKQLTRILFEIETHEHLISEELIWLKVDEPTEKEMNQVIESLKPQLQKNLKEYDADQLVEELKRSYLKQKYRNLEELEVQAV